MRIIASLLTLSTLYGAATRGETRGNPIPGLVWCRQTSLPRGRLLS